MANKGKPITTTHPAAYNHKVRNLGVLGHIIKSVAGLLDRIYVAHNVHNKASTHNVVSALVLTNGHALVGMELVGVYGNVVRYSNVGTCAAILAGNQAVEGMSFVLESTKANEEFQSGEDFVDVVFGQVPKNTFDVIEKPEYDYRSLLAYISIDDFGNIGRAMEAFPPDGGFYVIAWGDLPAPSDHMVEVVFFWEWKTLPVRMEYRLRKMEKAFAQSIIDERGF
jgi:hypothetical protein